MLQLTPSSQVGAHLIATAWMSGISIVMAWIFEKRGFFKWGAPQGHLSISTPAVIEILCLYLVISWFGIYLLAHLVMAIGQKMGIASSEWRLFVITSAQIGVQILFALLASLYAFAHRRINLRKIFKNSPQSIWKDIGIGMVAWLIAFPVVAAVDGLMEAFNLHFFGTLGPLQNAIEFMRALLNSEKYLWRGIVITVLFAPLIEEFVFRGCLQTYLCNRLSRMQAIVLTSVAFAGAHFHIAQGVGNIPLLCAIFTFSLFLGFVYERQHSLFASISLHATFNAISIARLLLES